MGGLNDQAKYVKHDVSSGKWFHVICTWSPSNKIQLYIDGELKKEKIVALPTRDDGDKDKVWLIGTKGKTGMVVCLIVT